MGEIIKSENTLKQAREYIKLAEDYARYKLVDGYNEDDFSILEIFNLDASLTICDRGPADYYYEKAYDMLCVCGRIIRRRGNLAVKSSITMLTSSSE